MSLIDTIKEMGSIAVITIVFGVFLSVLIKSLPNHFGNQNYGMFFNLLIVLAGLQLFTIIYIGAKPYTNLYRDAGGNVPLQDNKNFFYYWWDWMYPGYGTKGIELDVFMYIAYLMVVILIILVVLNKVNNRGDFDSQDFKNPIAFGICLLEDNGYNIFLFGNIFMFLYISRFMMKGLNLLGSKEVSCPVGNVKSCFSEKEVSRYSNIIECNNKMAKINCPAAGQRHEQTLKGCPTVDNEYFESVFNYKLPLEIQKVDKSFKLVPDKDNPSYSELSGSCTNSINDFLKGFDADFFPPKKCGEEGSGYLDESSCPAGHFVFQSGQECMNPDLSTGYCTEQDCCNASAAGKVCTKNDVSGDGRAWVDVCLDAIPGYSGKSKVVNTPCTEAGCDTDTCCSFRQHCDFAKNHFDLACAANMVPKEDAEPCSSELCTPEECCTSASDSCYLNKDWASGASIQLSESSPEDVASKIAQVAKACVGKGTPEGCKDKKATTAWANKKYGIMAGAACAWGNNPPPP